MRQRDQTMRLATAEARVEPEDRPLLLGAISQPQEHLAQKLAQAPRRVGVGEETGGSW